MLKYTHYKKQIMVMWFYSMNLFKTLSLPSSTTNFLRLFFPFFATFGKKHMQSCSSWFFLWFSNWNNMFALVTITEIILAFTKITALFFYKPVTVSSVLLHLKEQQKSKHQQTLSTRTQGHHWLMAKFEICPLKPWSMTSLSPKFSPRHCVSRTGGYNSCR